MNWFFIALSAPMIWAGVNHIDKFIISKYTIDKKPEVLLIATSFASGLTALLIFFFARIETLSLSQILWVVLAGMFFVGGYIPYVYALQYDDVSVVAPLYQMIAPISYILGFIFLRESLSGKQILASLLILFGSILLTLNFEKLVWKGRVFKLMFISCLILSLDSLIFKKIGLESSFWTVSFWEYIGAFIFGIALFCVPVYRTDFKRFIYEGGRNIVSLNLLSESMNIIGRLLFNSAVLLAPISLVYVVAGTQPFFIFLYSIVLFYYFKKINSETLSSKEIIFKLAAILVMILGSTLLFVK